MKDPKKYWFKRKKYGYGWVPSSWQGWSVIILYGLVILHSIFFFPDENLVGFIITVVVSTLILHFICRMKGPKLKWNWGKGKDVK